MVVTAPERPARRRGRPRRRQGVAGVLLFALALVLLFIAAAFATGYLIGKLLI
jgi:Flp pilus assembly protein TadG